MEPNPYVDLPTPTSFRVAEILPGNTSDPISYLLHTADWKAVPSYDAVSYAWGDPNVTRPVVCEGKIVNVTENLHSALTRLRFPDRSRNIWADALCINQRDIPERSLQVRQMLRIYRSAQAVLVWLGPDTADRMAEIAVSSLFKISDFVCERLGIPVSGLGSTDTVLQEVVSRNRDCLPLPSDCDFSTASTWKSLRWLYSHPYFTRVWAIQEIAANKVRLVYANYEITEWERVELVASYIIMETTFSKEYDFSTTYCWWAASTSECAKQPKSWLFCLYLASNYRSTDARDHVYGLRGLMDFADGGELLDADYSKSVTEVYRDSVEAALVNFKKTDVLLYVNGNHSPSWIPRWDEPMLFRNPFRFGKQVPWQPTGDTKATWGIDKRANVLSLTGCVIGTVRLAESYNESIFGNALLMSEDGRSQLRTSWKRILTMLGGGKAQAPLPMNLLTAAATSFSFGLDEKCNPAEDTYLTDNFSAYLKLVLEESFSGCVEQDTNEGSHKPDGYAFGKPVWDFEYPESSVFVTGNGLVGCCTSVVSPRDIVFAPLGCVYPLVLRPEGDSFFIRGYSYTHGVMYGEQQVLETQIVDVR